MSSSTHEIVILGANFGGIGAAHYLLRQTVPSLQKLDPSKTFHITLVSPNTHFFFKIASPRALINDTLIPEEKIFKPISEGFSSYPSSQFTFIQGTATELSPVQHTVAVRLEGKAEASTTSISFDSLLISTGTTSASPLWTLHGDHKLTIAALKSLHTALPNAKTVLIAGGGPVGVETAGEIANAYPATEITLLSGAARLLTQAAPGTGARAQSYLETNTKAQVVHNVRITSSQASEDGTSYTIKLSDGTERTVDLYIDATGGRTVNTQFLPKTWLDDSSRVLTGDAYFRVKGTGADAKGVYVIGDAVAGSVNTAIELDAMTPTACSSIAVDIASGLKPGKSVKKETGGLLSSLSAMIFGTKSGSPVQKEFKPMKGTIAVPIGPSGGVGQIFGWRMPSFLVKTIKAKNFLLELVEPLVSGEKYAKA